MTISTFRTALLAAVLLPAPALAQLSDDAIDDRADDIVVTATGVPQAADETGVAVTVIDRATLARRQTVQLSDILVTTPGVAVSRNGGPGTLTTVRLRGAESGQTLVLIDGVRVNDPSSPDGAFDFASLFTLGVDRVEVLRGAASVPWGSQAIGGVVNVITERAPDGFSARGRGEYGWRDTIVGEGGIAYGGGRFRARADLGYFDTDGLSAAAVGTERDGYRRIGANGRVEFDVSDAIAIDLRGYWADGETELDGFPPPRFVLADTDQFSTSRELYGYAGLRATTGPLVSRAGFSIADIDRENFASRAAAAPEFRFQGRSERFEYRGELAPVDPLRLVFGAEREDSRFEDARSRFTTGITSVHAQAIVQPFAGLTLAGGLRHDDHEDFGGNTVFQGNGALSLASGTIVRGSYAEGFKAPTLFQLFAPLLGTPTLRPERSKGWDAGIEQRLVGGLLSAAATWFHRDTRNQIDFDLATFTFGNIARTESEGLEVALRARPAAAWSFEGNYTYLNARNRSPGVDGNRLARRPVHSVSASIDYAPETGPAIGATLTHVGDSFDNGTNTVRLDGYVLASVRAAFRLADRYELYGRIENLFDTTYRTVAGFGTPGRAAYVGVRARFE